MPVIGAHVSVAGGLWHAFDNAAAIGATAIQIFGASPRQWGAKVPDAETVQRYAEAQKRTGLGPVFLHAPYLANLATPKDELYEKSVRALATHLSIAEALHAVGLIFHIGSGTGSDRTDACARVVRGMQEVLRLAPGKAKLIMENAAGGGDKIGATPEEIGEIFHAVDDPRVGVCLDTQHAFASGLMTTYTADEVAQLAARIETSFGAKNLVALHLNDSQTESGSHHDRHENIGEGKIDTKAFQRLADHPTFASLPWLLEVPGFDGAGPDKKNVEILKKLLA